MDRNQTGTDEKQVPKSIPSTVPCTESSSVYKDEGETRTDSSRVYTSTKSTISRTETALTHKTEDQTSTDGTQTSAKSSSTESSFADDDEHRTRTDNSKIPTSTPPSIPKSQRKLPILETDLADDRKAQFDLDTDEYSYDKVVKEISSKGDDAKFEFGFEHEGETKTMILSRPRRDGATSSSISKILNGGVASGTPTPSFGPVKDGDGNPVFGEQGRQLVKFCEKCMQHHCCEWVHGVERVL